MLQYRITVCFVFLRYLMMSFNLSEAYVLFGSVHFLLCFVFSCEIFPNSLPAAACQDSVGCSGEELQVDEPENNLALNSAVTQELNLKAQFTQKYIFSSYL